MRGKAMGGPSGWQHGGRWPLAMSVHHTGACRTGLPLMVAYLGWEGWGGGSMWGAPAHPCPWESCHTQPDSFFLCLVCVGGFLGELEPVSSWAGMLTGFG